MTKATIPLVNLRRQIEHHAGEFSACYHAVVEKTDFIHGNAVREFENAFALYCQSRHCIGVGNGTDALALIFRALNLQPGDEVITTAMSFIATAEVLSPLGIKVIFADIDPETHTLDPRRVELLINKKTRAILPVHLYGQPADMAALSQLAEAHGLYLIEDAAQSHGADYDGKRVGSIGKAAAFSFYPGKNLGAFGDAGGITTSDAELAERIRMLANHGRLTKYEHLVEGVNSRLDTFQAAVLLVKLKYLDAWNDQRRRWAALYGELLSGVPGLQLPLAADGHVYHLYVVQTDRRDALLACLNEQGIQAGIHYPIPLHLQPAFRYLGYREGDFPIAERLAVQCLSLPMFPELTEAEVRAVASAVWRFFNA